MLPKKQIVEDFKDLRPISLVGGLYKILSKVLANRIKRVMDKVISKSQNAFIEGRQILDAFFDCQRVSGFFPKEEKLRIGLQIEY